MAERTSSVLAQSLITPSYFPTIPPKVPSSASSYPRYIQEAPYSALTGVVVDGRRPEKYPYPTLTRCRVRKQVGTTNRWRLPESLYSDFLGSSQAIKSIHMPINNSMMNIISAESPMPPSQFDINRPYSYRLSEDRPYRPVCANYPSKLSARYSTSPTNLPPSSNRSKTTPNSLIELKTFTPKTAYNPTPKETFLYHSKKVLGATRPDVLLNCLKTDWELHRPFLQKSDTLAQLLKDAPEEATEEYYKQLPSEAVDDFIGSSHFYDKNYPKAINKLNTDKEFDDEVPRTSLNPSHYSKKRSNSVTVISLVVRDAMVTRKALALALGSLYTDDITISEEDAANVLAAASVLGFKQLIDRCKEIILRSINFRTVCKYHRAASQYNQDQLVEACEKWLELNFIPQIAIQIQLREVPMDLIQKILKSNRLFVYNEYSIYRALVYWLFFQLNPDLQLMPSQSTIISFFNSLPKTSCIIEREEGQSYAPLFSAVRLHGITDTSNIHDMQMMNVVPQKWLIDLLSQHYHSLQAGGDMSSLKNFQQASVRYGFIIDTEPHYHSEIISLHGFHFELKAVKQGTSKTYVVYLQRLKPGDSVLSFRQCERHTFSMRPERSVRYNISVSYYDKAHQLHENSTGVISHKFGLGERTSRSETLTVENAEKPLYISFAIHFPPS
ncbi:hypothetical protein SNE40_012776 [Patella caerulea]|uniref:BTB/POZ domain-containing protein 16 n=1 Tax=Patella caerulea TaxID=87958 RepID=A0AAN8JKW0_PATCE